MCSSSLFMFFLTRLHIFHLFYSELLLSTSDKHVTIQRPGCFELASARQLNPLHQPYSRPWEKTEAGLSQIPLPSLFSFSTHMSHALTGSVPPKLPPESPLSSVYNIPKLHIPLVDPFLSLYATRQVDLIPFSMTLNLLGIPYPP